MTFSNRWRFFLNFLQTELFAVVWPKPDPSGRNMMETSDFCLKYTRHFIFVQLSNYRRMVLYRNVGRDAVSNTQCVYNDIETKERLYSRVWVRVCVCERDCLVQSGILLVRVVWLKGRGLKLEGRVCMLEGIIKFHFILIQTLWNCIEIMLWRHDVRI